MTAFFIHLNQFLVSLNSNFQFTFRCDKTKVLKDSVLLHNAFRDLLCSFNTKFLKKKNILVISQIKMIKKLPPIASYVYSEDELWFFSWLPTCWRHPCTAIQLHEQHDQLDKIFGPIASRVSSLREERTRAFACQMVVECLQKLSSDSKRAFRVWFCKESFLIE